MNVVAQKHFSASANCLRLFVIKDKELINFCSPVKTNLFIGEGGGVDFL